MTVIPTESAHKSASAGTELCETIATTTVSRTLMDPKLVPTPSRGERPITNPSVVAKRDVPVVVTVRRPREHASTMPPRDLPSRDVLPSIASESSEDELDMSSYVPAFDYGFMWSQADVSLWTDNQSTTGTSPEYAMSPRPAERDEVEPMRPDRHDACPGGALPSQENKSNISSAMERGPSRDLVCNSDVLMSFAGSGDTLKIKGCAIQTIATSSRRRQEFSITGDVACVIAPLYNLRRPKKQIRLSNESGPIPRCLDSFRLWDPYQSSPISATLFSTSIFPVLYNESIESRINWLDFIVASGRRLEPREKRPYNGTDYHYTLIDVLHDRGGTMNARFSWGPKLDRIETRRRELLAIMPYRYEDDRRSDLLPKLWLRSVWQILQAVWLVQQSELSKTQRSMQRKREHSSSHLCEAPLLNASGGKEPGACVNNREELIAVLGASPRKKNRAEKGDIGPRGPQSHLTIVDLNSVLEEEKARRLRARAKELSLLQRFGFCLDKNAFEIPSQAAGIDEENQLGMNQVLSRKDSSESRQQKTNGPTWRCESPSSVNRKLKRKRACEGAHQSLLGQCLSSKTKKGRSCDRKEPDLGATPLVCVGSPENSATNTVCEGIILNDHGWEFNAQRDDSDNSSPLTGNDSEFESPVKVPRPPNVYDDVVLSDRAKNLLQNLEMRSHTNVEESIAPIPEKMGQVKAMDFGLPTVTPKLSKRERKKHKRGTTKKEKKKSRKKANLVETPDQLKNTAGGEFARRNMTDEDAGPTKTRTSGPLEASSESRESSAVAPEVTETARCEETSTKQQGCEETYFPHAEKAFPAEMATLDVQNVVGNSDFAGPMKVLCSESFLEQWGELIQILASGSTRKGHGLGRKLCFVDTDLMDDIGIDIEFYGQVALIITSLSQAKKVGFESLLRRVVDLAAMSKYKALHVFICADIDLEDSATNGLLRLQNATMNAKGLPSTAVFVHLDGPGSLANSVIDCLFVGDHDHGTDDSSLLNLEENLAEPKIRERVLFLLSISPSMTLGNAFRLVHAFRTTGDVDSWFPSLLSHASSGRGDCHGIAMDPNVLRQLSFALSASLVGSHR